MKEWLERRRRLRNKRRALRELKDKRDRAYEHGVYPTLWTVTHIEKLEHDIAALER